jgi:tetratricopeptide (TPR) repeat protein
LNSLKYIIISFFILFGIILFSCDNNVEQIAQKIIKTDSLIYLNHSDSAKYVGINTCKLCHQNIYDTYIKTGMGKSFDIATKAKSVGDYKHATIYDKIGDFYYKAFWEKDSLRFLEYRLKGKDTLFKRLETVNFIIGSGQHTNSHIQSVNGYLNQMPMTFYSQKQKWDLPPGFEDGHNTRFTRKIGLECMSCHNNYPEFVLGSENKYKAVPEGINCERCHGPGSIHVSERQTGRKIDTSKYIDYSIVNPSKLSINAQFDICQRCHLQGNTILKEGKSFYDFKPGMKLSDYMTVFLPKYKNADDEFIMASHADRLKQSACFIKSLEKSKLGSTKSLKPYKDAMTCVTCHNPHVSVKETNTNVFNDACNNCHNANGKSNLTCSDKTVIQNSKFKIQNCVSCHMPKSGSIDIPHVTVHDHFIRKPITKKDKQALKEFIGLYAINEKTPSNYTKAKAYLNQYEKFEQKTSYLDSAANYLKTKTIEDLKNNIHLSVQLEFTKKNYTQIMSYVNKLSDSYLLNTKLITKSFSNEDAWTSYRIAESFYNIGNKERAILYFKKAVELAPFGLDFKNKFATVLASNGLVADAEKQYQEILNEYPKHVSALTNFGYIKLMKGDLISSEKLYLKALAIDPDYEPLLLNLAGLCAYKKDFKQSQTYLFRLLKKNPNNQQAQKALKQINSLM